jgi:hypothetical protein
MTRTHMLSVHTLSCPLCVCSYTEFSPLCLCPYMVMGSGGYAGAPRCGVGLPEASPEAPILESPTLGHVRPPQEDAGAAGRGLRLRRRRHGVGRAFDCNGKRESEELLAIYFHLERGGWDGRGGRGIASPFHPPPPLPFLPLSLPLSFSWSTASGLSPNSPFGHVTRLAAQGGPGRLR